MVTTSPGEIYEEMRRKDERAIAMFLMENQERGATVNDWFCATDEMRETYRRLSETR